MVYRIGVFADTHFGSPDAIAPPEYYIGDDDRRSARVSANKIQSYAYGMLEEAADELQKFDLLVLMGDMCDGPDAKSQGSHLTCSNLDFQVNMGIDAFSILKPKRIISVSGSDYHNGNNLTTDHNFCDYLGAKLGVTSKHADEQFIKVGDRNMHFRHKTSYIRKKDNRVNGLINEIREYTTDGYYDPAQNMPHLIVRAHVHYFEEVRTRGMEALTCPCWKWKDHFGTTRGAGTPDLGYIEIDVDGSYYETFVHTFKLPARLDSSGSPLVLGET